MPIDMAASEAIANLAKNRLSEGLAANGVDAKALPPQIWTWLLSLLASLASGGCPPKPTPPAASESANEIKTAVTNNPLASSMSIYKRMRREGVPHPLEMAAGIICAVNASTVEEVSNFASLDASL